MDNILGKKVLVLNQSYEPLMVIGAKRAIISILSDKSECIANYSDIVRSQEFSMSLPSIIRIKQYVGFFRSDVVLNRMNILKRDNFVCQYCSRKSNVMTIDHIFPRNKGGKNTWENLVAACVDCNAKKGDNLLENINMKLLKKPKKPNYLFYFKQYINTSLQNSWKEYLYMKN
tara:strand:+ start:635 stop:1153 length:519 start_codon:yes stop_codon:yes gene_type:complete